MGRRLAEHWRMTNDIDSYIVVLRARSSARFRGTEGVALAVRASPGSDPAHVKLRTRWVDAGFESPIPRELWIEVSVREASLDVACASATRIAGQLSVLAAFCANVTCEIPEVHVAYLQAPKGGRREFVEVFQPNQIGLIQGRMVDTNEYVSLVEALADSPHATRLYRALNQYDLALRYWYIGGEWLHSPISI